MLLKIGWKHGMGPAEGARAAEPSYRPVLLTAMIVLGRARDLRAAAEVNVPSRSVVLGPERAVGRTMVMLPSAAVCRR
jgi:hypothetical protein